MRIFDGRMIEDEDGDGGADGIAVTGLETDTAGWA